MTNKKIFLLGRYFYCKVPPAPVKVAQKIFDELTKQKCDVTFIEYFFDGRKYNYYSKLLGEEIIPTNSGGKVLRLGILRFFILLIKSKPDIVHMLNFERFPLAAFLLRPFLKYKIFCSIHGIIEHERAINSIKIKKTYLLKENLTNHIFFSFSDKLLFLSEGSVKIASKYYKLKPSQIKIVANGIDHCFGDVYSSHTGSKDRSKKIVFIADYGRKQKGLEFLLDVLNSIELNLELFIIGTGYDDKKIYCHNKAINIYVLNKMNGNELAEFYIDKDLFISTSLHDSFGMAPAEAMAAGLVPVVTKETGMSRFIKDGINGFTFNYGDGEALAKILVLIFADDKIQKRVSLEAAKIYEKLSWGKISEMYQQIYNLS